MLLSVIHFAFKLYKSIFQLLLEPVYQPSMPFYCSLEYLSYKTKTDFRKESVKKTGQEIGSLGSV